MGLITECLVAWLNAMVRSLASIRIVRMLISRYVGIALIGGGQLTTHILAFPTTQEAENLNHSQADSFFTNQVELNWTGGKGPRRVGWTKGRVDEGSGRMLGHPLIQSSSSPKFQASTA